MPPTFLDTPAGDGRPRSGAQAVEGATALLGCFADHGAVLSLTQLALVSGFPKSTTYRIAEAMARGGMLERDDSARGYRISLLGAALRAPPEGRTGDDGPTTALSCWGMMGRPAQGRQPGRHCRGDTGTDASRPAHLRSRGRARRLH